MVGIAAVLVLAATTVPAAAAPRCFGAAATIVSSDSEVLGTRKDDVIVMTGSAANAWGRGGDDRICGNAGSNIIQGGGGNDRLRGGSGSDYLVGNGGNDHFDGDAGDGYVDVVLYMNSPRSVRIDFRNDQVTGEGTDTFKAIEQMWGSAYDDRIIGDDGWNYLYGWHGDDFITGGEGFDVIEGGLGNDRSTGGGGSDPDDVDVIAYRDLAGPSGVVVDLGAGVSTGDGDDTFSGFEAVQGSSFNDTLTGSEATDFLVGGPGDDQFDGTGGFDYAVYWLSQSPIDADLQAGTSHAVELVVDGFDISEGDDTFENIEGLMGTVFSDQLTGDAGDNYLEGWLGDDAIDGGAGDDWLDGGDGTDAFDGGPGTDVCLDGEDPIGCEEIADPSQHPLYGEATLAESFRRNFRRNF